MGPDDRSRTLWVSTVDGSPLTTQPIDGPLWSDGDALWQWIIDAVDVPLYDDPTTPSADRTASVLRATLRELVEGVEVEILSAPTVGAVRTVEHEIRLESSVGPFLFLTQAIERDAFGAHGSRVVSAHVWDLRAAAESELLTERERADFEGDDASTFVALAPRWEANALRVGLRYTSEVCYACSDREWSDYTRSHIVDAERVPEQLAPFAELPAWVRTAAERMPDARLGGWSVVDAVGPSQALDSLRR